MFFYDFFKIKYENTQKKNSKKKVSVYKKLRKNNNPYFDF
jgi:hypothetical protein